MFPKYHILFAVIFAFVILIIFPKINIFQISIIFLSSILIDIDHYLYYVFKKRDFNPIRAYNWFIKTLKWPLEKRKESLMVFHTFEFLVIIAIFSFFSSFIFLIFIGLLFHFVLDTIDMVSKKDIKSREFFLTKYLLSLRNKE